MSLDKPLILGGIIAICGLLLAWWDYRTPPKTREEDPIVKAVRRWKTLPSMEPK